MAADFQNIDGIDWDVDATGQTAKANAKFLSDFINGTNDGGLLTPYNTILDAVTSMAQTDTLYLGGGNYTYSLFDSDGLSRFLESDILLTSIFDGGLIFDGSNTAANIGKTTSISGVVMCEMASIKRLGQGNSYEIIKTICFNSSLHFNAWVNALTAFITIEQQIFISGINFIFRLQSGNESGTHGTINNSVYTSFSSQIFNSATSIGIATANATYYESLHSLSIENYLGGSYPSSSIYFDEIVNCLFHPSCEIIVNHESPTLPDAEVVYASMSIAKLANPSWFPNCEEGDIMWVSDHFKGLFPISRNSDIYTKITGFENEIIRPSKDEWVADSASSWTFSNSVFDSDLLKATAAIGTAETEIDLQSLGLQNPTAWLSKGLDYASNTPTSNTGGTDNYTRLTFEADYKEVGQAYTGLYHIFGWNTPIGFDGSGASSGETGYNPTDIQPLNIESIKLRVVVQLGLGTALTGIYGFYIAPSFDTENLGIRVVTPGGDGLEGAAVTVDGTPYTSQADGFIDLLIETKGVDIDISATLEGAIPDSETINLVNDYEYHELTLTPPVCMVQRPANFGNFVSWNTPMNLTKADLTSNIEYCDI